MISWEEMAPRKQATSKEMIGGKPPKSTSKQASTAVHLLVYKLMQSRNCGKQQMNFQFKDALSYIKSDPGKDKLLFVELETSMSNLSAGDFCLNTTGGKAANVIEAFPARVECRIADLSASARKEESVEQVLTELKRNKDSRRSEDTPCFIISCNVISFWFSYATFKARPTSTFLNQKGLNKVIFGQALTNVLPCFQRMTLLALADYKTTERSTLEAVNQKISNESYDGEIDLEGEPLDNENAQHTQISGASYDKEIKMDDDSVENGHYVCATPSSNEREYVLEHSAEMDTQEEATHFVFSPDGMMEHMGHASHDHAFAEEGSSSLDLGRDRMDTRENGYGTSSY